MELKLEHITHCYGDIKALDDVTLQLTPGIYALLGPNGAGKSTMMKLLTTNLVPTKGSIYLDGKKIQTMKEKYRSLIGYMPQQQGMYESFRVDRFLAYMGALKGMKKNEIDQEIDRVLQLVNLSDCRKRKISTFSGGMKQRLLIAQAIMNQPQIIILDEPTAGLDPKERIRIRNIVSKIAKDKIVLFATHVVSDIEHIAKEVILLKKGKVIAINSVSRLCQQLEHQVFEIPWKEEHFLKEEWTISQYVVRSDGRFIRIISKHQEIGKEVSPTLEDVYLSFFQQEER